VVARVDDEDGVHACVGPTCINLKIKLRQSFKGAHKGRVCVRIFIGVSNHTCCIVFLKKRVESEQDCNNRQETAREAKRNIRMRRKTRERAILLYICM
jgi:hypothetical protein